MPEGSAGSEMVVYIFELFELVAPLLLIPLSIAVISVIKKLIIYYSYFEDSSSKYSEREKKLKAYDGYEDMWLLKECMYIANKSNSKKIAFLAGLFEDDPKIFNPLMIKYRETFKVIHQVLVAAKKESLENDASDCVAEFQGESIIDVVSQAITWIDEQQIE